MRRNFPLSTVPTGFPITVKKGHAVVKIYAVKNRDTTNYTVAYLTAANGRKRKTFADLELAKREAHNIAAKLATDDLDALKLTGGDRQIYVAAKQAIEHTGLPLDSAAREFAHAVKILGHANIVDAARYYKKHVETRLPDVRVAEAVEKFAEAKRSEGMSAAYLKDIKMILGRRFAACFQCNIASIVAEDLRAYLNGLKDRKTGKLLSPVAKNNHRRLIVVLSNFAKAHGWLRPNEATAADALGAYKVKERDVEIYTPSEVARLLAVADADFVPFIVLQAFGGMRREELRRGLQWSAINFDRGTLVIPAAIAKTGRKRKIDLPKNALAWLAPYRGKHGAIFAKDPGKRIAKVSTASRVKWKANALRHSYGSYRLESVKNAGQVALEMGNSAAVVMRHYFEIVDAQAARDYWNLKPAPQDDKKIVRMA
jgi:integrase